MSAIGVPSPGMVRREARSTLLATVRPDGMPRLGPALMRSGVGMALVTADGRWVDANPALCDFLGYPRRELLSLGWQQVTPPEDVPAQLALVADLISGRSDGFRKLKRYIRKDGAIVHADLSVTALRDELGSSFNLVQIADVTDREEALAALARSQEALAAAEAVGHVGHWTWRPGMDGAAGDPVWSPEAYRILGLDPSGPALNLDRMTDLLTPESLARSVAAIERALADGHPYTVEIEFDRPDGIHGWAEIRGAPERRDDGTVEFVGVLLDVSALRIAERDLRERERELAEAQRVGQTGSFRWDPATESRRWSAEMYRLYGREVGSGIPTRDESASQMRPEEFRSLNAAVAESLRTGEPYSVEYDLRGLDGIERRVLARGEVEAGPNGAIRIVRGTVSDITEIAAARNALVASEGRARRIARDVTEVAMELAASERELEEAQRVAGVGSWRTDLRTGVRSWSEELLRIHGLPPGRPPLTRTEQAAFAAEEDLRRQDELTERCAATGESFDLEFDLTRTDGARRRVLSHAEAVRDEHGAIVALRGTMTDITPLVERRELQARRIAARGDYLDRAEHTLRTHLTVVEGWAEAIADTGDSMDADTLRRAAAAIARNANALTRLMHGLMIEAGEYVRTEGLEPVPVDAAAVAGRVVDEYRGVTPVASLTVEPHDGVLAMGTEDAIATVVGHLVENATKFSGEHGTVVVEVRRKTRGLVEIAVMDDGPGVDPGLHPFEPFSRSGPKSGHGLGLHVVKTLVEAMGGTVRNDARPDGRHGARFVVTLRAA